MDFSSSEFEKLLEKISSETGTSPDLDYYEYLFENPVCLKRATITEFLQIPGFTTSEARKIISICSFDSVNSIEVLKSQIKLTYDQIQLLKTFTTFDTKIENNKYISLRIRNKNYIRKPESYSENKLIGDDLDLYQRVFVKYNNLSLGLLTDKDFGEKNVDDFLSGFLSVNWSGYKFLIGDYFIETGLGNILWKNFGVRKSADVIYPLNQIGSGLKEYRSATNYRFFRGVGLEKLFTITDDIDLNLKSWYSLSERDGNYDSLTKTISSVYKQGYFRTSSEIHKISAFKEQIVGNDVNLRFGNFTLGSTLVNLSFDKEIQTESKQDFSGKEGNLISFYGFFNRENFSISGEFSEDANYNKAFKIIANYALNNWNILLNGRSYDSDFRSPYGYNFGESATPSNEWGIYTGLRYNGLNNMLLSGYFDFFGTYSKSYYVSNAYRGFDLLIQSDYIFINRVKGIFRMNFERKPYDEFYFVDDTNSINRNKLKVRFDISKPLIKKLNLRFRLDGVYVFQEKKIIEESGLAFLSELVYNITENVNLGSRFSLFATDSYKSAIWQYEIGSAGYMSTVPLYESGFRAYIFADVELLDCLNMRIRYSIHQMNNRHNMGSGLLTINGNKDERLIFQMDFRY